LQPKLSSSEHNPTALKNQIQPCIIIIMKLLFSLTFLVAAANAFVVSPVGHTKTSLMSSVAPRMDLNDPQPSRRVDPKPEDSLLDPNFFVTYLVALAAPITATIYPGKFSYTVLV
jgi:hypothetical protein